uniref:Uncharacterized protein n=1 Tax=Solanum lycopersicum TaxID=4081 RepID=A0A3Q7GJ95_SOLLC
MLLSWLMNNVSKELMSGILIHSNGALVWSDLKERYEKVNMSRIFHLHKSIVTRNQDLEETVLEAKVLEVTTYFIDDIQDIVLLDESQASALTIRPVGLDYIDDPIDTTRHSFDIDLRGHLPIPNLLMRNKCLSSEKQQSTRTSRPPLWQ